MSNDTILSNYAQKVAWQCSNAIYHMQHKSDSLIPITQFVCCRISYTPAGPSRALRGTRLCFERSYIDHSIDSFYGKFIRKIVFMVNINGDIKDEKAVSDSIRKAISRGICGVKEDELTDISMDTVEKYPALMFITTIRQPGIPINADDAYHISLDYYHMMLCKYYIALREDLMVISNAVSSPDVCPEIDFIAYESDPLPKNVINLI